MSSITKRMKKLSVQRDQYVNPWDGLVHSRAALNGTKVAKWYATTYGGWAAEEIRADRIREAQYERDDRKDTEQRRRVEKPVYGKPVRKGLARSCYWIKRKTPDRSVSRMSQGGASTCMAARLLSSNLDAVIAA